MKHNRKIVIEDNDSFESEDKSKMLTTKGCEQTETRDNWREEERGSISNRVTEQGNQSSGQPQPDSKQTSGLMVIWNSLWMITTIDWYALFIFRHNRKKYENHWWKQRGFSARIKHQGSLKTSILLENNTK